MLIWLMALVAPAWVIAGIFVASVFISGVVLGTARWSGWLFSPTLDAICGVCGYDLRASKERCPECGTPIEECGFEPDGGVLKHTLRVVQKNQSDTVGGE